MSAEKLTAEEVREWLGYDPATGILTWKKRGQGRRKTQAGGFELTGYGRVMIAGQRYMVTHLIWAIVHGKWPDHVLDHKNRNPHDNRLANLREATETQNQINRRYPPNKTGFLGVSRIHRALAKPFVAIMKINSKSTYLGTFTTAEEAAAVVQAKREELHGDFAK